MVARLTVAILRATSAPLLTCAVETHLAGEDHDFVEPRHGAVEARHVVGIEVPPRVGHGGVGVHAREGRLEDFGETLCGGEGEGCDASLPSGALWLSTCNLCSHHSGAPRSTGLASEVILMAIMGQDARLMAAAAVRTLSRVR